MNRNLKHKQLTNTALKLFLKFGFKRVSIEEICKTAGVSKMTFYKFFKNKIELIKYLLDEMAENQMNRYHDIMNQDIPYPQKVKEIIRMKQDQAEFMGQELFNDLYADSPSELTQYLHQLGTRHLSVVRDDFIQAQKEGYIRKDIHPDFILYFMNHMIDLVSDEYLTGLYSSSKKMIHEMTQFFFYGIMSQRDSS